MVCHQEFLLDLQTNRSNTEVFFHFHNALSQGDTAICSVVAISGHQNVNGVSM